MEDPPWVQRDRAQLRDIDYVGLALIALGLGALQIMLDRGEDSDWFTSPTIQLYALLAAVGIVGGVAWLLLVEKPVVDLRCLKDRNFGVGVVMVSGIGAILYSTNVIIPVMAQQWFGYTALLAGLLLSPGAAVMIAVHSHRHAARAAQHVRRAMSSPSASSRLDVIGRSRTG